MKVARTVRRGADGKGLSGDTTCTTSRQVYGTHGTSPAAYSTTSMPIKERGTFDEYDTAYTEHPHHPFRFHEIG